MFETFFFNICVGINKGEDVVMAYVPSHLYFMLFELIKVCNPLKNMYIIFLCCLYFK